MNLKIQRSPVYISSKRPTPTCSGGCRSSMIFISIMRWFQNLHFLLGQSLFSPWRWFSSSTFSQRLPRLWHSFEPGASSVLLIGHCVPGLHVPKLIGIAVFNDKTVSQKFFFSISRNALWSNLCSHHEKTAILWMFRPFPFRPHQKTLQSGLRTSSEVWAPCAFPTDLPTLFAPPLLHNSALSEKDQIFPPHLWV